MKFICSECNEIVVEGDVIIQDINEHIRFLCESCHKKWCGEDEK